MSVPRRIQKINTALGMSGAVAFVLVLATLVTYLLQYYVLNPLNLGYLQTIAFILVIAALVQLVEIILKKVSPSLYQALGVFLPLITTNCAVLGVAILVIQKEFNLMMGVWYALSTALGFGLALVIFAGIREQLNLVSVPKGMQGMSIALVTAGLLAMGIYGFQWSRQRIEGISEPLICHVFSKPIRPAKKMQVVSVFYSLKLYNV